MTRATDEWFGRTDDAAIPPRIRLRVWARCDGRCQCGCNRRITVGESWQVDHTVALINGGGNRESNLRIILTEHHKEKTAEDVATKSKVASIRAKHIGIKTTKHPMPCGRSSKFKKRMDGKVVPRIHPPSINGDR